jgi:hypothetical protein
MPVGGPSSQPFEPSDYTSDNASVWKAKQDANSSIVSPFGALYVYANSPAAMNVKVDVAAILAQAGFAAVPFLLNSGAPAVTVSLSAPGSNSYIATIYWDKQAQAPGVVYGASGVSPTPILPEKIWQVPLALVTIASTDTSVQPTAIQDCRQWQSGVTDLLSKQYAAGATANQTLDCTGATEVDVDFLGWTSGSGTVTLTLNNLRIGVRVHIYISNASGSTITFKVAATTPGGVAYQAEYVLSGAAQSFTNLSGTGAGISTAKVATIGLRNFMNAGTPQLAGPYTAL